MLVSPFERSIEPESRGRSRRVAPVFFPCDSDVTVHRLRGGEALRPLWLKGNAWGPEGHFILRYLVQGSCGRRPHAGRPASWRLRVPSGLCELLMPFPVCGHGADAHPPSRPFLGGVCSTLAACPHADRRATRLHLLRGKGRAPRASPPWRP